MENFLITQSEFVFFCECTYSTNNKKVGKKNLVFGNKNKFSGNKKFVFGNKII
jgi:hypothetical protein